MDFDVTKAPPSLDDLRHARQRINRKQAASYIAVAVACAVAFNIFEGAERVLVVFYAALAMVVATLYFGGCRAGFRELPRDKCARFHRACIATPEGQAYRAAVLAQGRTFTINEFQAIRAWADGAQDRKDCAELYGIATE